MYALTVNRGVSLFISSKETSIAITPKMSWFCDFWKKKNKQTGFRPESEEDNLLSARPTYNFCCSFWMSQVPLRILNDFKEMGYIWNLDSLIPKSFTCCRDSLTRHFQPLFSHSRGKLNSLEVDKRTHLELLSYWIICLSDLEVWSLFWFFALTC